MGGNPETVSCPLAETLYCSFSYQRIYRETHAWPIHADNGNTCRRATVLLPLNGFLDQEDTGSASIFIKDKQTTA